jgi:hypothetical protein
MYTNSPTLNPGQATAMPPKQLLQLADTMAKRHAAQGYTGEALLLHVEVLRQQGRLSEAADLVAKAGTEAISMAGDRRSLHASLLVRSSAQTSVPLAGVPDSQVTGALVTDALHKHRVWNV